MALKHKKQFLIVPLPFFKKKYQSLISSMLLFWHPSGLFLRLPLPSLSDCTKHASIRLLGWWKAKSIFSLLKLPFTDLDAFPSFNVAQTKEPYLAKPSCSSWGWRLGIPQSTPDHRLTQRDFRIERGPESLAHSKGHKYDVTGWHHWLLTPVLRHPWVACKGVGTDFLRFIAGLLRGTQSKLFQSRERLH